MIHDLFKPIMHNLFYNDPILRRKIEELIKESDYELADRRHGRSNKI